MRRRIAVVLVTAFCAVASSAQIVPRNPDDDGVPSVTDPSVPLTYVGGDGSVSIGINSEGETEGQLLGVFARNNARAVVGQLWWDRSGAGGLQGDYNWLWGGDPVAAREHPDEATVSRLSFAVDQNGEHDRKATLGFGIERRAYSIEAWLARGISSGRAAGHQLHDELAQVGGSDDIGTYTQAETTTVDTLFESKPYGMELGVQFGHVFEPLAMRVHGGATTQDGDGARATTFSLGLDTPLGHRGWGLSALAEHVARSGGAGDGDDNRLSLFLRYAFGRNGGFAPTASLEDPAWISRSLARPSNGHSRTVETYRRVRSQTVSVTHGPRQYTNHFPVAQADSVGTAQGIAVTINAVANDSDADGDTLVVSAVTAPAHGTAVASGGTILYTPAAGFSGTDTFAYTVSDGRGGSASAGVTVAVGGSANQAPVARDDTASTAFGQSVTVAVLANDSDPDGDTLAITGVGLPAHGLANISGQGIVYVPASGYDGPDSFSYTIEDGHGGTATATVSITVRPQPNRYPTARDDAASTAPGVPVTIAVLANDDDPDGDTLTIAGTTPALQGTVAIVGAAVVYTSVAGATGTDRFTYTIVDGHGGSATASVTVTLTTAPNQPPVAVDDTATAAPGTSVTIPVLANDSDPDGDPLAITATTAPTFGTAVIAGNAIVYTAPVGVAGTDRFNYTIEDGRGGTATATVVVTIGAANQPPVAIDDAATAAPGVPVTIAVLANDSDPDGDPLAITATTAPVFGTAVIAGNAVVYTAPVGVAGIDRFTYTIADGRGGTATATVTVTIGAANQPPVAVDDAATTTSGTPPVPVVIAVLANDSDPDGDPLTIVATTPPTLGTIVAGTTSITYTPNVTAVGVDTFTYTIGDGQGGTATATVTVTVAAPNQPPVAVDDAVATAFGAPVTIPVLANDSDPDGDPLAITATTAPAFGTIAVSGNSIIYTPTTTFSVTDSFTYTIEDGRGGSATATVRVTVGAPNQPPIATDDTAAATAGVPLVLDVLDNDSDPDGDPLTITEVTTPGSGGIATINGNTIVYTSAATFIGTEQFTYTISDGNGHTATATVTVVVN